MSRSLVASTVWRTDKWIGITGHERHRHKPSPISTGFNAPDMCKSLRIGPTAIAASIARTATLQNAPAEMLARWRGIALTEVEYLIENSSTFTLTQNFYNLADAERSAFAGHVGAGITDLLMNALGYTWRDNAACLAKSLDPRADFIYGDGAVSGHGVVLAEARGSFARKASAKTTSGQGRRKYYKQVRPHLAKRSPHGSTVHGYSIAFGSRPGTPGAFLHASETLIPRRSRILKNPVEPANPESTPTSLALATHRSNFSLMDASRVVAWIDWVRGGMEDVDSILPAIFLQIPYAGRMFLASAESLWPYHPYWYWLADLPSDLVLWSRFRQGQMDRRNSDYFGGLFVMEEKSAERFLSFLSAIIRRRREIIPDVIELPQTEPEGFAIGQDGEDTFVRDSDYAYALYRDGLALLGSPLPQRINGYRIWSPRDGMEG